MNEIEKLRALLAEARAWMGECDCRTKLLSPTDNAFLAGIDAALAEPSEPSDSAKALLAAKVSAHADGHEAGWFAGYEAGREQAVREAAEKAAEAPKAPEGLTDDQKVWVIRLCKAMQMWAEKSHGAYTIGIGTEHEEHFSPRELANRALKELGIKAQFAEPPPNKKRGK
jgi:hypothetical protein